MPYIGRKPGEKDTGYGYIYGGNSRASIMGRPGSNGWAYRAMGRVGYNGGNGVNMQIAVYATSGGNTITNRIALTPQFWVSTYMADHWSGADHGANLQAPLMIHKTYDYALALGAYGGALNLFGQDMSGWNMHDKDGVILPGSYAATRVAPEGKMSLWLEYEENVRPDTPSNLSPAPGSITIDNTPTLGGDFRDANEELPGFAIGTADKMKAYRFEVLNAGKTSVLQDTGIVGASPEQQAAQRAEWTAGSLGAGTYVARLTVYDMFDTPSPSAEWSFTVNAGGAVVNVEAGNTRPDGTAHLWEHFGNRLHEARTSTVIGGTWTHSGGLLMDRAQYRLLNSAGSVIGTSNELTVSIDPNASTQQARWAANWTHNAGMNMPALQEGQAYYVEMRGRDTTGLWSGWNRSPRFLVNAKPGTPTNLIPGPNHVTDARPELSAILPDANDAASTLGSGFYIRRQGDTGDGVYVPEERRRFANGRHYAQPSEAEMPSHGIYEWRARSVDPWGELSPYSAWQVLTYATPPVVTVTAPSGTIATGTPTIRFTSDKTLARFRVAIRDSVTGYVAHESGDVTLNGPGGSYTVPAGVLRNGTSYTAEITATDTVGLSGFSSTSFTVQYPAPTALASFTVDKTPGPYEYRTRPGEWSRLVLSFAGATAEQVSDADFAGYIIRRTNEATGQTIVLAHLLTRGETVFVDKTVASRVSYRYQVSYLKVVNGIDLVESRPVTASGSVTLQHSTITSMDADDLGAPLRYWDDRDAEWITDVEIVPSWGPEPIGFQGPANSTEIKGDFAVLDAEDGTHTAEEVVREVRAMATPRKTGERTIAPRVVCYRDPRGRVFFAMIHSSGESDEHNASVGRMDLTITQIAVEEGVVL